MATIKRKANALQFYANPYDTSARGFYFSSAEDFEQKSKNLLNSSGGPVEEFEIDFIDGSPLQAELAKHIKFYQNNLGATIAALQKYGASASVAVPMVFLLEQGEDLSSAEGKVDDITWMEGRPKDYVEELLEDVGGPSKLDPEKRYVDVDNILADFEAEYSVYTVAEFREQYTADADSDTSDLAETDRVVVYSGGAVMWATSDASLTDAEVLKAYAEESLEEGNLSEDTMNRAFDIDGFTRDLVLNGDVKEIDVAGTTYTVTNANAY